MRGQKPSRNVGISTIHARGCPQGRGGDGAMCDCKPKFEAWVYDPVAKRKIRKTFPTVTGARNWRHDAIAAVHRGALAAPGPLTINDAADALIAGMKAGTILSRSKRPYKPSTVRDYERILDQYIRAPLGARRLATVRRRDIDAFVIGLAGLSASTVHNILDPLRVIFRRALRAQDIVIDPTDGLELPSVVGRRDRIEPVEAALALVETLPTSEQGFWATALFCGLRRGELRALPVENVRFDEDVIVVEWGWDPVEGIIDVKSTAGHRAVPMAGYVRSRLRAHILATGRRGKDLVFGRTATEPFYPSTIRARALKAWRAAGLEPLSPHEARHCAATYLIESGANWREAMEWIGHSDVRQTINRYAHVQKGAQRKAARNLDALISGNRTGGQLADTLADSASQEAEK